MMSQKNAARRVVIYRLGSLGDTVVALPCFHLIAQAFPDAERIALTNFPVSSKAAALEAVLGGSGLVHRSVAYPVGLRAPSELWALASKLRALEADTLVYLTPSRGLAAVWRDMAFFRFSGFTRIIGAPLSSALQRNRPLADGTIERECERLVRCLASLGRADVSRLDSWDLRLGNSDEEAAAAIMLPVRDRPYIAINMGGKVAKNDWGVDNWNELLDCLSPRYGDHALLVVGGAEDSARAAAVGSKWPGPVIDACGVLAPRASAAAMKGARVFVGHDSGPLHLAACIGVACVGIFGDNNPPIKWHPPGSQHVIVHNMSGVMAIPVAQIARAVESILGSVPDEAGRRASG